MSLNTKIIPVTYAKGFHDEEICKLMKYNVLGKTGLLVSNISLGGAVFSSIYGDFDENEAITVIQKGLKSGINYIDTAPWYGQGRSEEILGKAFKTLSRSVYYVATKVGRYETDYKKMFDFSAKKTRQSVENSLKLMGLNYIDIVQIHDIEFAKDLSDIINECLPELEKLVDEGKIRFIGVTSYSLACLKECIELAPGRFHVVLTYARYTLMDNSLKDYIEFFQNNNLGIVCASGLAMGLLTNNDPPLWHPATNEQKSLSRNAAAICQQANVELGKLAMHYFLQLNGAHTFLVGMKTYQILDNNLNIYYYGLNKHEQEILQVLQQTTFNQPCNWEGIELERYWSAMNQI